MFKPRFKNIQFLSAEYTKKVGDKYIDIGFDLYSSSAILYSQAQAELSMMLEGFTLN